MATIDDVDSLLAGIGSRLRALRHQRAVRQVDLSTETGISISALSRLESGRRRPTLEQLILLAEAYKVPVDDLIREPDESPAALRPTERNGTTFVPLTTHPAGLHAFKIVTPVREPSDETVTRPADKPLGEPDDPARQVHHGRTWMCVLSGRVRLRLGEHDLVMTAGEVADFDTTTPHWYASAGPGPAEVIALFGPQGERVRERVRTTDRPLTKDR
jgi:transcriptional regulator with XRE-family HTH domain